MLEKNKSTLEVIVESIKDLYAKEAPFLVTLLFITFAVPVAFSIANKLSISFFGYDFTYFLSLTSILLMVYISGTVRLSILGNSFRSGLFFTKIETNKLLSWTISSFIIAFLIFSEFYIFNTLVASLSGLFSFLSGLVLSLILAVTTAIYVVYSSDILDGFDSTDPSSIVNDFLLQILVDFVNDLSEKSDKFYIIPLISFYIVISSFLSGFSSAWLVTPAIVISVLFTYKSK